VDEMRMKTAFTPFTLDESSAMHIQSVKCKFALRANLLHFNDPSYQEEPKSVLAQAISSIGGFNVE